MSRHNPNNTNCDLLMYAGSDDVKCSCDVDPPPEPSVSTDVAMPPMLAGAVGAGMSPATARLFAEYKAAAKDLDVARKMLKPAQERFERALNAFTEAAIAE